MAFRRDHEEQTFSVGILPAPEGGNLNLVEFAHPPANDEAPCMGSGYGGGGELPAFPTQVRPASHREIDMRL
jgi:hypothetical protein